MIPANRLAVWVLLAHSFVLSSAAISLELLTGNSKCVTSMAYHQYTYTYLATLGGDGLQSCERLRGLMHQARER